MIDTSNIDTSNLPSHPQYVDAPPQTDEHYGNLFDWKTISARCISPDPHHPAYDMSISEYIRRRGEFIDHDDSGKAQVIFRVPPVVAMGIVRMARKHHISPTKYITFILEHGLITFQKDYHAQYSIINAELDALFDNAKNERMLNVMAQSIKQTISLGSACNENRIFGPNLQEWMVGAIKSTALELNCTQSDMAFMCVLIGMRTDSKEFPLPKAYMATISTNINKFEFELDMLKHRIQNLLTIKDVE